MPQGTLLRCERPVIHTGLRTTGHPGQSVGIMWGRGERVAERKLLRASQHTSLLPCRQVSSLQVSEGCCGQGSGQ